jgi:hypothetical protein
MHMVLPTLLDFQDAATFVYVHSIGVNTAIKPVHLALHWASSSCEMHRLQLLPATPES